MWCHPPFCSYTLHLTSVFSSSLSDFPRFWLPLILTESYKLMKAWRQRSAKSTHFCTPTHLSCALHLCVLSLEMTPFLLALLVPSDISEGWTGATVPPHVLQLLHISFSIFTTLEMSCFCGWWVKSIAQREKAKPPSMPFIFFYSTWQSLSICLIFIYLFFNSLLFCGVH